MLTCRAPRSLIKFKPIPIRTNSICPWMTKTRLVTDLESMWSQQGLPSNTAQEVALAIAGKSREIPAKSC